MCRANIVAAGSQCAAVGILSSGTVHNAVRAAAFCQSAATAEIDQRTTPIIALRPPARQAPGPAAHELRKIPVPESLTEQKRLQRSASSGLQNPASQRRQLEPEPGRLDQPRHIRHRPQQMQLPHLLLVVRLRKSPDRSLLRLLSQAQRFHEMVLHNRGRTMTELAIEAGVGGSYFTRILRLSFLAPEVVKTILRDRHPLELTAKKLAGDTRLPIAWEEQRVRFGIA